MNDRPPERLDEEEAARLWQRAAQLQAEAARRADRDGAREGEGDETALAPHEGYELEHVRAAAEEAGIGGEYLDAALADLRVERSLGARRGGGGLARRFLGNPPDVITVTRVIEATPREVLRAMEEVVPHDPFNLVLRDQQGDPLDGGLLVFDIDGAGFTVTTGFTGQASQADLREVFVTLRAAPGRDGAATEVSLRGPVAWAHSLNAGIGGFLVGIAGVAGFAVSVPIGLWVNVALLGGAFIPAGMAVTALGFGASVALGTEALRALYRQGLDKGRRGLSALLGAVALKAQGGWGLDHSP